ncbi:metal ABC transporter substrate-binding protein [Anabaena subtropica]|uniref:Zinc ABC transporter substrate-binding protein n=1 Tax=Anabaena subtropica FACHB-260 TaxID=2692884 RepID=A0ABR8CX60_9NOST|nr:metal ABC transporter substrate-binding protein [Anabaena subtropica]MBD2346843.1 zinc ABC transporter substrate-binding protein [Anabaena subtropica FACHB-260]
MTLLIFSVMVGCNQSNSNQGTTGEQSPRAQEAASSPSVQEPKTKVVATILPIYLFTKAVAGEAADVSILIPPSTEIHEYQATPDNVRAIATANVLIKNGLGLEEFLDNTVKNAQNPQLTQIDASKNIKAVNEISPVVKTGTKSHSHSHAHDHAEGNPHVWLDPVLAKQQVANIRDGLIAADPANKTIYQANAEAYIKELDNLHNEFQQTLQKTPNCTFITFHDAFPYLAQRYNLKQVAVVQIPEDQLSPADVQKTVNTVKKYNVKALFSEPGVDNKLLTSLSKDLNLTLRPLSSLESGETNPKYYFQAMKNNLQTLEAGCK